MHRSEYSAERITSAAEEATRYRLRKRDVLLSVDNVLDLWVNSAEFTQFFVDIFRAWPGLALRFECRPINIDCLANPFEFALIDCPHLAVPPDPRPFHAHIGQAVSSEIVAFDNLTGDARLVVPAGRGKEEDFSHLLAFLQNASSAATRALWLRVAREVRQRLSAEPLWLSTAGDAVAWLHVRLDSRPKYYQFVDYRSFP